MGASEESRHVNKMAEGRANPFSSTTSTCTKDANEKLSVGVM